MKTNHKIITALLLSYLTGCASLHNGNYATQIPPKNETNRNNQTLAGLRISGHEQEKFSSENFGLLSLTFENMSSKWLKIKNIEVDFGDQQLNDAVKIPVGTELRYWAEGTKNRMRIEKNNAQVAMGIIAIAGAVLAVTSNSHSKQTAGLTAYAAGTSALVATDVSEHLDNIQNAAIVPDNHLLAPNFAIPPHLTTRKWIVLYTENPGTPFISDIYLTYTFENNTTERVKLHFRHSYNASNWQHESTYKRKNWSSSKSQ